MPFAAHREVVVRLPGVRPAGASLEVIDTESRDLPAAEAAAAVAEACRGLEGMVYKKVDSTLRGHVLAELKAARAALGRSRVVLAPSLPAQGRVVREGRLWVAGEDHGPAAGAVDAQTDADLDRIAADCLAHPDWLPAGSAGLAAAFARLEEPHFSREKSPIEPENAHFSREIAASRVLVAIASGQPATVEQVQVLRSAGLPRVQVRSGTAREVGAWVARNADEGTAVIASGGEAALAVCRALGVERLRPLRELLPGLVLSAAEGGPWLVTKAGGFGGPSALLDAALKLLGDG